MPSGRILRLLLVTASLLLSLSPWPAAGPAQATSIAIGNAPAGMALNPVTGFLYVANAGDGTVSIIATGSSSVVGLISLEGTVPLGGSAAPVGVGVDVSSNLVFVAESGAGQVAVIDGATNSLRNTIRVDVGPWGIAVNQATNTIFVTNLAGSVTVIDGLSGTVSTVVRSADLKRPLGVAVDETRNRVYVANRDGNSVTVLDGSTYMMLATVPVGGRPVAVAVDVASGAVYVANNASNSLSQIDPGTNAVIATLTTGTGPVTVASDPQTGIVYAASSDNTVSAFSASGAPLGTLIDPGLNGPQALLIAPGGSLYVSNGNGNGVTVLAAMAAPVPATD